jgi:hypothetical protein
MPAVEVTQTPVEDDVAAPAAKPVIGIIYPPPEVRSILCGDGFHSILGLIKIHAQLLYATVRFVRCMSHQS